MSQLSDTEILKQAEEIKAKNYRDAEEAKKTTQEKAMKSLVGKFYVGSTSGFADEDGVEAWRVLSLGFHPNYVYVEHWVYAHSEHYKVELINWHSIPRESIIMKQVTEIEFMQQVSKFFKKIGLYKIFNEETNH